MLDKNRVAEIHRDLSVVLKKFAAENGLTVSPFNMTYSESGFKFAVQMGDKSMIGDADPVYAANVRRYGLWYDMKVEDIGKEFAFGIEKVTFNGLKNKNTVIYTKNGQKFRTDATRFAKAIGRTVLVRDFGA